MSWLAKVCFFSALLLVSAVASATTVTFGQAGTRASLETRLLNNSRAMGSLELKLSIPSLEIERSHDGFSQISVPGLVPMEVTGSPEVYTTGSLIAVPEGFEPVLNVVSSAEQTLPNVHVAPSQNKFRCSTPHAEGFAFNAALYASDTTFPSSVVGLEEVGKLQGLRLVRVAMNPVRMNMGAKSLTVTHQINVRVDFKQTREAVKATALTKPFYELARSVTANGSALGASVLRAEESELMLVVTADTLKETIEPLVAWKRAKGLKVDVVTLTEAGGTKEKVKAYIQNYYDTKTPKPSYLLFVGNKTSMPPYFESTGSGSAATDYTFSLLSGDDKIPDVVYGRIVADNADDAKLQLTRWIDYEKTPDTGASWYQKYMGIASDEGSGPSDKEYAQQVGAALMANTFKSMDSFFQGDGNATSAKISDALKDGRSWIAYFGHGSGTSWGSTNDTFNVATVGKLQNDGRLPIIIDVACANGAYTNISKCFGKAWVTQTNSGKNAGAVAFLGGSVNISWHPPAIMSLGIAKYHFEKATHSLGASILAGQLYLIEKKGNNNSTIDNLKWYNLFGDPSMLIRTDTPLAYDVKATHRTADHGVTITVNASDKAGKPVKGVLASVRNSANEALGVAKTDAQGTAEITLSGMTSLEPGTMVTTTGYNLETVQTEMK